MGETLSRVALDISGRPYLVWNVTFTRDKLGDMDTALFREWFQGFAPAAGVTLHLETFYGLNTHPLADSCFKTLSRELRPAVAITPRPTATVPPTTSNPRGPIYPAPGG